MNWSDFEQAAPDLAAFGEKRLHGNVAYLATTQKSGAPRVHPVTPVIGEGHFFVFMEPTSPKGKDLERDGRYAIHCSMTDSSGESGEFWCMGTATRVHDPELRAVAVRVSSYTPANRYILFELDVERAQSTLYEEGNPVRQAWKKESV
jgi:hypothetical protein